MPNSECKVNFCLVNANLAREQNWKNIFGNDYVQMMEFGKIIR